MLDDGGARHALWRIRMVHTIAWTVFASSIVAIPLVVWMGSLRLGIWLSLLVWAEVLVLAANGLRCPLTAVAARYTADRSDNFDIFLPAWLARHNKLIFGSLFVFGEIALALRWALR